MSDDKGLLKRELAEDGLHPNPAGYAIMAPLAEQAIGKALQADSARFAARDARSPVGLTLFRGARQSIVAACVSLVYLFVRSALVAPALPRAAAAAAARRPETDDDFPLPLASGLAPTPPMGWNSWNKFACNINEDFVKRIADGDGVDSGMKDAGYQYVNIDDCWSLEAPRATPTARCSPTRPASRTASSRSPTTCTAWG